MKYKQIYLSPDGREEKRKWANRSKDQGVKNETLSESFVINLPRRKPYPSIRIEVSEHNSP